MASALTSSSNLALPPIAEWFDSRRALRFSFLQKEGWGGASMAGVGEDGSFRRYFRLERGGETAVLMESLPDGHARATPGHKVADFIRIDSFLRGHGLNVPEIFAADVAEGFVLMEDMGGLPFALAAAHGHDPRDLYVLATDVLRRMAEIAAPPWLPDYYASHVHAGRRRLVDWYCPACLGRQSEPGDAAGFLAAWDEVERGLPRAPEGFLHVDFHLDNLMLMPRRAGLARCGVLDFQGAMRGPLPYDLANLLEDARRDVPPDIRASMLDRFCAGLAAEDKAVFLSWYRVLSAQFHCRIIGQFIRLAVRDGRMRYLAHMPRVAASLRESLRDPLLAPVSRWCRDRGIDFRRVDGFDPDAIRPLIAPDAF